MSYKIDDSGVPNSHLYQDDEETIANPVTGQESAQPLEEKIEWVV